MPKRNTLPGVDQITALQALDYEVGASWWACWIGSDWAQNLVSRYFAWKVNRKFRRYKWSVSGRKELIESLKGGA